MKAPWIRDGRIRERGQHKGGAEQNTNTGTPTQRTEAGSREAAEDRRRGAREDQNGCTHALVDVQRGTWNIKDEYLSAAAQSNAKSRQGGVEGNNTPHRAEPLVPP